IEPNCPIPTMPADDYFRDEQRFVGAFESVTKVSAFDSHVNEIPILHSPK
ncbi:unnamed protein product, partial [marine sediment metagenome]